MPHASCLIPINGLNLDAVWQNIVAFVGKLEVAEGNWKTQARMTPAAKVDLTPENNLFLTP
ncbi:MAG: hypothetical protein K1V75_00005, partial [Muribaculaceae bacterium]